MHAAANNGPGVCGVLSDISVTARVRYSIAYGDDARACLCSLLARNEAAAEQSQHQTHSYNVSHECNKVPAVCLPAAAGNKILENNLAMLISISIFFRLGSNLWIVFPYLPVYSVQVLVQDADCCRCHGVSLFRLVCRFACACLAFPRGLVCLHFVVLVATMRFRKILCINSSSTIIDHLRQHSDLVSLRLRWSATCLICLRCGGAW